MSFGNGGRLASNPVVSKTSVTEVDGVSILSNSSNKETAIFPGTFVRFSTRNARRCLPRNFASCSLYSVFIFPWTTFHREIGVRDVLHPFDAPIKYTSGIEDPCGATEARTICFFLSMPDMDGSDTFCQIGKFGAIFLAIVLSASEECNMEHPFPGQYLAGFLSNPCSVDEMGKILYCLLPLN